MYVVMASNSKGEPMIRAVKTSHEEAAALARELRRRKLRGVKIKKVSNIHG